MAKLTVRGIEALKPKDAGYKVQDSGLNQSDHSQPGHGQQNQNKHAQPSTSAPHSSRLPHHRAGRLSFARVAVPLLPHEPDHDPPAVRFAHPFCFSRERLACAECPYPASPAGPSRRARAVRLRGQNQVRRRLRRGL